jgi:hypothetical protein
MNYIWCIASYNRVNRQPWLTKLHEWGYTKNQIILSTQTQEDYDAYQQKWGEWATVIYKPGTCISDNKNTLLDYVKGTGLNPIMCSDKVRGIKMLGTDSKSTIEIKSGEHIDRVVRFMIRTRDLCNGEIAGIYSAGNALYMSRTVQTNRFMLGCFMIFKPETQWRFEPFTRIREDEEVICQVLSKGMRTVRFNFLGLKATFHTKGGCYEMWNSKGDGVYRACYEFILRKYPSIVEPDPRRDLGFRCKIPTQKIPVRFEDEPRF